MSFSLKQGDRRKIKPNRPRDEIVQPSSCLGEEAERLFERVATEALHGDRELFNELSPHERGIVIRWLSEAIIEGEPLNTVHDTLWEIDYIRKPVDIETWIKDDYYFGKICAELHPLWIEDLLQVFAPGSQVTEWIETGAIGVGKTTVAMTAMGYKIHCIGCLRDAASYYGLLPESLIIFGIYSITKRQVADTGYYKLRGWIDTSPYFRTEFPRSMKIDSKIDFKPTGKNIQVIPGSQELHALGLDLFTFSMDEVNFMQERRDKDRGIIVGQAYELYNATHTRMMSRFIRPGGMMPGIMILMSSRTAQTSFLEERLKKAGDSPHTFVSDYALWEVKATTKFTLPRFRVEVGDRITGSRILKDGEEARQGVRVVEDVPGEFRPAFVEDIDQALRDIAGVATFNVSPLIRDRESIFEALRDTLIHPFTKPTVTINYKDDVMLDEFFTTSTACRIEESRWVPRLNPKHARFIHVDLAASGDCGGIAMGHVSGTVKHSKMLPDGTFSVDAYPFIIMDFMLRIVPPASSEIDLSKIRAFILYLSKLFPLAKTTFDGWQSLDSKQLLRKAGLEAEIQSIDKKDTPYLSLRSAHFDRRIAMYKYAPYINEVLDLQRDAKKEKVDHPTRSSRGGKGSKDVSDAVAGVVFACMNDPRAVAGVPLFDDSVATRSVVDPVPDVTEQRKADRRLKRVGEKTVDFEKLREGFGPGK